MDNNLFSKVMFILHFEGGNGLKPHEVGEKKRGNGSHGVNMDQDEFHIKSE